MGRNGGLRGALGSWRRTSGSTFWSRPGSKNLSVLLEAGVPGQQVQTQSLGRDGERPHVPRTLTFLAFLPPTGAIFTVSKRVLGTDTGVEHRGERFPLRSPELPLGGGQALYSPCSTSALSPAGPGRGTRPPAFFLRLRLVGNLSYREDDRNCPPKWVKTSISKIKTKINEVDTRSGFKPICSFIVSLCPSIVPGPDLPLLPGIMHRYLFKLPVKAFMPKYLSKARVQDYWMRRQCPGNQPKVSSM